MINEFSVIPVETMPARKGRPVSHEMSLVREQMACMLVGDRRKAGPFADRKAASVASKGVYAVARRQGMRIRVILDDRHLFIERVG